MAHLMVSITIPSGRRVQGESVQMDEAQITRRVHRGHIYALLLTLRCITPQYSENLVYTASPV